MLADQQALVALVVEDDWLIRADIVDEFETQHWTVIGATSGEEALELARHHAVDVVVTDIQLAGCMNGWDVAEAIRIAHPEVPVIYASGRMVKSERCVEGGLFFEKPYNAAAIVRVCERLCAPQQKL